MARPLRIQYPGAIYHIMSRGNGQMMIYLQKNDWTKFILFMERVIIKFNWICYAYCLMGNHYHLLIETPDANLASGMKYLNQLYSQHFNWKYSRVGSVLQGRYKAWLIEKEEKFLDCCRYIVNNPVEAKLVEHPSEWEWSSFRATRGIDKPPDFLNIDVLLGHFNSSRRTARKMYEDFVLAGLGMEPPFQEAKHQIFLGSDSFIAEAMKHVRPDDQLNNVPRAQKFADRPSLENIFDVSGRISRDTRNKLVKTAFEQHAYTQREIGEFLGLHPGHISNVLIKLRKD